MVVPRLVFQARSTLGGWREARATPCREVREEIAIARGPDLRRAYLRRHLANVRDVYRIPCVVALNRFPTDTDAEIALVKEKCKALGVEALPSHANFLFAPVRNCVAVGAASRHRGVP